jgi:hypothetical protein
MWSLLGGDDGRLLSDALRLLAASVTMSAALGIREDWRWIGPNVGMIAMALFGTSWLPWHVGEKLGLVATALLILHRWWRCRVPPSSLERAR